MGITLSFQNFVEVFKNPKIIFVGVTLQYVLMPLFAFLIAVIFGMEKELIAGMVLVGACPGGTASNVVTFLANGKVALSIALTSVSTILAILLTPYISYLYLNQYVDVPIISMLVSVLQVVLVPVIFGTTINTFWGERIRKYKMIFPFISVAAIVIIIAIVVALNKQNLSEMGLVIIIAVMLHNSIGLTAGYYITKLLKYDEQTCRTVAIEVGMQNSGLAVALAIKFYGSIAAIPGAIFSIWHNLSGSLLASFWRKKSPTYNK
jgi:BASS family bile acid:Na+ symporter